jgi:hypothetical protein
VTVSKRDEVSSAVRDAVTHIEEGGFTEAAVRAILLMARRGNRQRRLSTLKRIRELVGDQVGLLDVSVDDARAIIQRQAQVVDHDPERAMATLPKLLPSPRERQRLLALLEGSAKKLEFTQEQRALLPEFQRLLSPQEVVLPFAKAKEARR